MSAELVLHLELDGFEVVDEKEIVRDASGKNHIGALQGDVDIVVDDTFGACASFDGNPSNYITVPSDNLLKITGDVTVQAWVYVSQEASPYVRLVGRGSDLRDYGLWSCTGDQWLLQRYASKPQVVNGYCPIGSPTRVLHTWYHLAGVIEGTKGSLYLHDLQGKCIGYKEIPDMPSGPAFDTDEPLTIGYGAGLGYPAHTGKIAHVRVYNGARTQAEIELDIASDCLALVPFRKSHPIDFHLYDDDDDQAVLYISDDPAGYNLRLELRNTSTQSIQLHNGKGDAASEDNHHFALRFRPGTLSDSTLKALHAPSQERAKILKQADQWDLYFPPPPRPAANEAAVLYLLYKGPEKSFTPDERRTLTLQRMSAAPGTGARGTQVELLPHQLTAEGGDTTPITGNRTQYMHITNRIGHKYIPLHVWFEGGNTVLNDCKTDQDLTLRIGNGSYKDITLTEKVSRFLISFDAGTEAWALAESVQVFHNGELLPLVDVGQGVNSKEWELKFPEKKTLVRRGDPSMPLPENPIKGIEITIKVTKTPQAPGHANVYLRYEGMPGYQDGQFILTVEKSPLVAHDGNVGIGRATAKAKLSVNGGVHIGADDEDPGDKNLKVDGEICVSSLKFTSGQQQIQAIYATPENAQTNPGNTSIPTVAYVTQLITNAINQFASINAVSLLPNDFADLSAVPEDKPSITLSGNRATFGGRIVFSTLFPYKKNENENVNPGNTLQVLQDLRKQDFLQTPLIKLYPPPLTTITGNMSLAVVSPGDGSDITAGYTIHVSGNLHLVLDDTTFDALYGLKPPLSYWNVYIRDLKPQQWRGYIDLSQVTYDMR